MKIKRRQVLVVLAITLFSFVGALFSVATREEPLDRAVAFITLGLNQEALGTEVSSYEILRATEHFSDVVLGWTVEPSFSKELSERLEEAYAFTGQRQEKQNLLFTVYGVESVKPAQVLVELVKERLGEYDQNTHAGYLVALERYILLEGERSEGRFIGGAVLLGFLLSLGFVILWDYATRH